MKIRKKTIVDGRPIFPRGPLSFYINLCNPGECRKMRSVKNTSECKWRRHSCVILSRCSFYGVIHYGCLTFIFYIRKLSGRCSKNLGSSQPVYYCNFSLSLNWNSHIRVLWCFVHVCFVQVTILELVWRSRCANPPRCANFSTDICSVIQEGEITVEKCAHRGASAGREHITTVHHIFC